MTIAINLRNCFAAAATCMLSVISIGQTIQPIGKNNRINYEKLVRLDGLINEYISKKWLNGAVTLIVKDNQVIQHKGYGYDDVDTKKPMSKDAIFRIASQTKAITSVGIMILYEQGKFLLDEPIANYLPEFKNPVVLDKFNETDTSYTTVPAKRDITFRDLLTHTSGIDYPGIGSDKMRAIYEKVHLSAGFGITKEETLLTKMKQLATLPLAHQPGEKWTYGLNCDLLGCLIEVISGTNLDNFLAKNVFEPLGMNDTYFNLPASKANRLVTVYTEDSLQHIIKWEKGFFGVDPAYPLVKKQYFSGGADLSSTAYDYAIFLQMMLNGGTYNGREILSRRTVEIMLTGQLDYSFNGDNNFGLGFEIVTDKGAAKRSRNKGSFAWGGFFGTTYWADPKEKLVCLIMTQQTPNSHGDLADRFMTMVYSSLK
jgi:CubicO group peptidase (beta-lactamase class C family)